MPTCRAIGALQLESARRIVGLHEPNHAGRNHAFDERDDGERNRVGPTHKNLANAAYQLHHPPRSKGRSAPAKTFYTDSTRRAPSRHPEVERSFDGAPSKAVRTCRNDAFLPNLRQRQRARIGGRLPKALLYRVAHASPNRIVDAELQNMRGEADPNGQVVPNWKRISCGPVLQSAREYGHYPPYSW